ncbi:glycosyltransferase [Desulfopila sp. IMCC35006]|uniref:glycosyltransferase family 2 protein n=1 Tax=Desulfopila sp. IMCC35006 TaxID=2569542 RepID=UPI0010AB7BB9|nr:glycosyltransferase family 2 protein [Desulfopila sp. IMCC35006]TKB26133.1 glycosyltransferase [Desulfopila sp. IMCC35006]
MLTVIVVNWNAGNQLRTCIDSILRYSTGLVQQIVVVDNGSEDGSDTSIEDLPNVTLIRAGTNLGFGRACNFGASHAQGRYLLFLNPDAALYDDTLARVLAYMQEPAHSQVGICGVQLLDEAGLVSRSCSRFPTAMGFVAHAMGLTRFIKGLGHFMTEWDHQQTRRVDHVIGAFFMVRRELFVALDGFDERFFVYLEDLDFSYRAYNAGWRSVFLAEAQAFHVGGGTSKQVKARRLFYSLRSRLLYACKHFSRFGAVCVFLTTLLVEPVSRSLLAVLRRSVTNLKEIWVAYTWLWCWLPKWLFGRG